ncbi:lipocalin-like domain-containing protein [Flavisericum labens]|uniref:lipocalin family protein n=1 Tax=Flavisericum labens TaxID=3377112 RepID=UPI00387B099D
MKKLILLFTVVLVGLSSCSNDDDSGSQDPLIGTWTWFKSFENGVEEPLDDCDKKDNIVVAADGTLTETYYYDNNGTCESDGTDMATWENTGGGTYRIVYSGDDIIDIKITFEGNTFFVEESETFGGETYTYKIVYIKS